MINSKKIQLKRFYGNQSFRSGSIGRLIVDFHSTVKPDGLDSSHACVWHCTCARSCTARVFSVVGLLFLVVGASAALDFTNEKNRTENKVLSSILSFRRGCRPSAVLNQAPRAIAIHARSTHPLASDRQRKRVARDPEEYIHHTSQIAGFPRSPQETDNPHRVP